MSGRHEQLRRAGRWLLVAPFLLAGCGDVCDEERMPTCDIREESCQDTVVAVVDCLRGSSVQEPTPVTVITPTEFEARLRDGADPMMMRTLQSESALKQLGMLAPDASLLDAQIEDRVTNTAAFFSSTENAVYVIDHGEPADSVNAVGILLHEMVHAAQHAEHDLMALAHDVETHEELSRLRLAVEGEATFYEIEALAWSEGLEPRRLAWQPFFDEWIGRTETRLRDSPSPYFVVYRAFPYVYGGRHATGRWLLGGDAELRQVLAALPPTSASFMQSPWSDAVPSPRAESPSCEAPPAPEGFEAAYRDEMGPLFVYAFLYGGGRLSHEEAWDLAFRWRRDDLHVYSAPDGRVAVAWRIQTGDPMLTSRIREAVRDRGYDSVARGYTVTLVSGAVGWSWDAPTSQCSFP